MINITTVGNEISTEKINLLRSILSRRITRAFPGKATVDIEIIMNGDQITNLNLKVESMDIAPKVTTIVDDAWIDWIREGEKIRVGLKVNNV